MYKIDKYCSITSSNGLITIAVRSIRSECREKIKENSLHHILVLITILAGIVLLRKDLSNFRICI